LSLHANIILVIYLESAVNSAPGGSSPQLMYIKTFSSSYFSTLNHYVNHHHECFNMHFISKIIIISLRKDYGVTPSEMLSIQQWSEFKTKYLLGNSEVKFILLNVDREIIIFGKKKLVCDLDIKIDEFLSQNKQLNSTLTNI
jgi:hypothetical protein